jgi:hypothetical protein
MVFKPIGMLASSQGYALIWFLFLSNTARHQQDDCRKNIKEVTYPQRTAPSTSLATAPHLPRCFPRARRQELSFFGFGRMVNFFFVMKRSREFSLTYWLQGRITDAPNLAQFKAIRCWTNCAACLSNRSLQLPTSTCSEAHQYIHPFPPSPLLFLRTNTNRTPISNPIPQ